MSGARTNFRMPPVTRPRKTAAASEPFWRRKTLVQMTPAEWESLCDGCAKCCLHKLEDPADGRIDFTSVACRCLDLASCRCTRYAERTRFVPDCIPLTPGTVRRLRWLPSTCAYRLVAEGRDLPPWHPLVSGDPESVHRARASVRDRAIAEDDAGDLTDHVVTWPE